MPPGWGEIRSGISLRGDACTQGMACLGTRLGICPGRALSRARRDRSLAFLLGAQGQCCGVWERPARKLLGVCLSCESLPELSHPARCCAVRPALPPSVPRVQLWGHRPAQPFPSGRGPDPSWKASAWFAFGFGFGVHQKPSCKMGKTEEILHLPERTQ